MLFDPIPRKVMIQKSIMKKGPEKVVLQPVDFRISPYKAKKFKKL